MELDSSDTIPVIGIDEVDASPLNLARSIEPRASVLSSNHQWLTYLYEEVGWLYCGKGYLEVLNDFDATGLVDTNSFNSRGIRH
jgi:hypothetical protein